MKKFILLSLCALIGQCATTNVETTVKTPYGKFSYDSKDNK